MIARLRVLTQELAAYYASSEWKRDFADDEAGLLPADLKRGVLSEDGLYDLLAEIKQKHINVILKLNCYRQISLDGETVVNPSPEHVEEEVRKRHLYISVDDAMILSEPDDTHMTVFNPDEKLLKLIKPIAASEGLFVWKPSILKKK